MFKAAESFVVARFAPPAEPKTIDPPPRKPSPAQFAAALMATRE